jgi:hypothetical protein
MTSWCINRNERTLHEAIGHTLEEAVRRGEMCRLLEVLQEPKKIYAQLQFDNDTRGLYLLVPVILRDVMRDKWMLVSRSNDGRDQGETIL